jgi:hypothetical protein
MDRLKVVEKVGTEVVHKKPDLQLKGKFKVEQIRDGKVIDTREIDNLIMNVGKNKLLDIMFNADTQITNWYIGLVDNASFTAFAAGDTTASHAGWVENEDYSETDRQVWDPGAASGQSVTNGTAAVFSIDTDSITIKGIFITSLITKGGATGTLWNGVAFGTALALNDGDQLKVTYTLSA